jgi:DNA-binding SARP family transcriptional activator
MKNYVSELIEHSSDAAFTINSDHRITAWNSLAESLLGFSESEIIGCDCGEILNASLPGGEPICHGDCKAFCSSGGCQPYNVPHCLVEHRNGDWITAGLASIALPHKDESESSDQDVAIIFLRDVATTRVALPHQTLQIFTLGGFGLVLGGQSIDIGKWKRKQAATVLKYLVTQLDRSVHRERLLDCLWPDVDEKQAWGRLKVTMYYLRRELRSQGMSDDVIKTIGSAYLLKRNAVWVDAQAFERLFDQGRKLWEQAQWEGALALFIESERLYRGDYLEEEVFEDWCAEERERLRELYLELLARMVECYARLGNHTEAIHVCRKALVIDQCRENMHYALMENLVIDGQPELALKQYRQCKQTLAREFGTAPLAKIQRLHDQILKEAMSSPAIGKIG